MSKMYKIPTIGAFNRPGKLQAAVPSSQIEGALQSYYQAPRFHGDMQDKSSRNFQEWPLETWTRLAEINPIKFLDKRSPFFQYDQINKKLLLAGLAAKFLEELQEFVVSEQDLAELADILR
ncbi:MAG TPA: hypothetical protein GXZ68_08020 [Firmicutes bacterium]|jgi:hypothetical protein|nr:hypothetical protein [Bacillota bacterium]